MCSANVCLALLDPGEASSSVFACAHVLAASAICTAHRIGTGTGAGAGARAGARAGAGAGNGVGFAILITCFANVCLALLDPGGTGSSVFLCAHVLAASAICTAHHIGIGDGVTLEAAIFIVVK